MPTFGRRRCRLGYADEHPIAESRFRPHPRGRYRYTVEPPQDDNDHLVVEHDLISGPLVDLDHPEAPEPKRLTVCSFKARAIDEEHRTLLVVAIRIRRHTSSVGNGYASQ